MYFPIPGSSSATAVVKEIMTLLRPINATGVAMDTSGGPDTGFWVRNGTPGIQLDTDNTKYFHFHHTEGKVGTLLWDGSNVVPICQCFSHLSGFLHHFALAKLATTSIRVRAIPVNSPDMSSTFLISGPKILQM